jgi:putative ATPase
MSGDLFDEPDETPDLPGAGAPLADRIRPRDLAEVVGPPELVGPESFLGKAIAEDRVPSLVFWGPPGSGKTTLARLIAARTRARFVGFSAVVSGIKEIKAVMEEAGRVRRSGRRTLLFVDEIHRFNRAQQDAFLPFVETGAIVLVGATTENPSFELNGALLSRLRVVILPPISEADLIVLMKRALADPTRGLGARVAVNEDSF